MAPDFMNVIDHFLVAVIGGSYYSLRVYIVGNNLIGGWHQTQ